MKVRVGGVPEHFNSPWKNAIANGSFEDIGATLSFIEYPGGTGAMCKALEANEVDMALLLTEGAVARALNNSSREVTNFKLSSVYVSSPLLWGVHVGASSSFKSLSDLTSGEVSPIFAISRFGSGSHLMSYVLMQELTGSSDLNLSFEVVGNLSGAREALPSNNRLVFLWEHFMTDPLVQEGSFRRIGDQPTPWPCFVLAVRDGFLKSTQDMEMLVKILNKVRSECLSFKSDEATVKKLLEEFNIKEELGKKWLESVHFHCEPGVSKEKLLEVALRLHGLGRVDEEPSDDKVEAIILDLHKLD